MTTTFLKPLTFLICLCSYVFFQSLLISGYLPASLSTIEKRYDLQSQDTGLIISAYDFGALLFIVPVSFFGGSSHRPRWIATGAMFVAIANVMMSLRKDDQIQ